MSDPRFSGSANVSSSAAGDGRQSAAQQAKDLAGDVRQQASEVAQHASRRVKEQASDLAEGARGLAADAGEKLKAAAEDQKNAGADFVSGFAGAVRRAASELDDHIPQVGQYVRRAADQIDDASEALRRRDLTELVGGIQDFARRQPAAFLGASALAGFAFVRFLKSATPPKRSSSTYGSQSHGTEYHYDTQPAGSAGSMPHGRGI